MLAKKGCPERAVTSLSYTEESYSKPNKELGIALEMGDGVGKGGQRQNKTQDLFSKRKCFLDSSD